MIDLDALDAFAQDHLRCETKCSRAYPDPPAATPPSDPQILCGLHRIRLLIMNGDIDAACGICRNLSEHVLDDPRVQLNIRIHKLFELLHVAENVSRERGPARAEALQKALRYSQHLADFALNAFPEAYEMFKDSMMLFVYPERTGSVEAIHERREKLADDIVALVRMTVCARESCLSFAIRYLLLIYVQFKSPMVTPEESVDKVEQLVRELLEWNGEDVGTTSRIEWKTDGSRPTKFGHRGDYNEADVQTLPERVNISRQEAIESLRFTNGDVLAALKNELGRVLINRQSFRVLVVEYCAARGLYGFETTRNGSAQGGDTQFPILSDDQERVTIPSHLIQASSLEMFPNMYKLRTLAANNDLDTFLEAVQFIDPGILMSPILNFQVWQCAVLHLIQKGRSDLAVQLSQEKLGPLAKKHPEFLDALSEILMLAVYASEVDSIRERLSCTERKASEGVVGGESGATPLVRAGDKRIRHTRPPVTTLPIESVNDAEDEEVRSFEEFVNAAYKAASEFASLEAVSAEVFSEYERKWEEPRLVQLLKRLLPAHEEWQEHNMMTDRFSNLLGIDEIAGNSPARNISVLKRSGGNCRMPGAVGSTKERPPGDDESRINEDSCERQRESQREQLILTLMEFLAMSRAEALAVVRSHPHAQNPQAILDSLLGTMI